MGRKSKASRHVLRDLDMPKGSTVGGVIRGEESILPYRDLQLLPGDKVVVFTLPKAMTKVARIFD